MDLLAVCKWIEATSLGVYVRESLYAFPVLVAIHILGLTLSVGPMVWFDLRLLGVVLPHTPVSVVYRRIIPWAGTGFAVMFASGGTLLVGYAVPSSKNVYFGIKVAMLILAATNAGLYHVFTERSRTQWDADAVPPTAARAAGLASLLLWATVIVCGRLMAYTLYD
jgi:hypothetical protein